MITARHRNEEREMTTMTAERPGDATRSSGRGDDPRSGGNGPQRPNEGEYAPDPNAEYWTTADVAAYLGVRVQTVSAYRQRGQMPEPDTWIGRRPAWRPATITAWRPQ